MKKFAVFAFVLLLSVAHANAASFVNPGFESGISDWSFSGDLLAVGTTTIASGSTNIWQVTPFETQMGMLTNSSGEAIATLDATIGAPLGTIASIVPGATNGSITWQDFSFTGPDSVSLYWAFVTTDYSPYNDTAFMLALDLSDNSLLISTQLASIGDVGSYNATGWSPFQFSTGAGNWRVAFGVVNTGDLGVDSYLFLDDGPGRLENVGGAVPEPATMLLLGSGLIGLAGFARRRFKR